jgi:hypothetical protein
MLPNVFLAAVNCAGGASVRDFGRALLPKPNARKTAVPKAD